MHLLGGAGLPPQLDLQGFHLRMCIGIKSSHDQSQSVFANPSFTRFYFLVGATRLIFKLTSGQQVAHCNRRSAEIARTRKPKNQHSAKPGLNDSFLTKRGDGGGSVA